MAVTLVPVNVEMPGQVGVFSVTHCIFWLPKLQLN